MTLVEGRFEQSIDSEHKFACLRGATTCSVSFSEVFCKLFVFGLSRS